MGKSTKEAIPVYARTSAVNRACPLLQEPQSIGRGPPGTVDRHLGANLWNNEMAHDRGGARFTGPKKDGMK
jgi:hypothetical protein